MNTSHKSLSLTGANSHHLSLPLSQGSLAIGSEGMNKKDFDLLVNPHLTINWDTFNTHYTGHGAQHKDKYPYGDWPRLLFYSGNDLGFVQWMEKRKTEHFSWTPQQSISADFTNAHIRHLSVQSKDFKIALKLGKHIGSISLSGSINQFDIQSNEGVNTLKLSPSVCSDKAYKLPQLHHLTNITNLSISVNPLDQPIDCTSLLQFKELTHLSLSGNLTNLHCLQKLNKLQSLEIRYAPNLEQLPSLKSWEGLTRFIAWNVEESKGKVLRSELKKLAKERVLDYSSVSQLRKRIWFTTEYGIPFSAWTGKEAKSAIKLYKSTVKKLNKAKTEQEVKVLLIDFSKAFNAFEQIETTQREDIAEAINQLRQVPRIDIDAKNALQWLDEVREY